jgi:Flp pilus assembly protein TadD
MRTLYVLKPLVLILLAAYLGGCASSGKKYVSGYETVAQDPHRDTVKAKAQDQQAIGLVDDEKYDDAEKLLKEALGNDVMYGPAHNNLGRIYYHQGKLYLAAWEFQYAIRLMPLQAEPQNNLGLVYESAGKLEDAMGCYAKAHDLAASEVQYMANLARVRIKLQRRDATTRDLLVQVVMRDSRSQWVTWAKKELTTMPRVTIDPGNPKP